MRNVYIDIIINFDFIFQLLIVVDSHRSNQLRLWQWNCHFCRFLYAKNRIIIKSIHRKRSYSIEIEIGKRTVDRKKEKKLRMRWQFYHEFNTYNSKPASSFCTNIFFKLKWTVVFVLFPFLFILPYRYSFISSFTIYSIQLYPFTFFVRTDTVTLRVYLAECIYCALANVNTKTDHVYLETETKRDMKRE